MLLRTNDPRRAPGPSSRPSRRDERELRSSVAALQKEVEARGTGPCIVRIAKRAGPFADEPITEVTVATGSVAMLTRHRDPRRAVKRAFEAVLARLPRSGA